MPLFGRKSITEAQAARNFVNEVLPGSLQSWPAVCEKLGSADPRFRNLREDKAAAFEFALALISIQMRALKNLLTEESAHRIEQHIYSVLRNPPSEIVISPFAEDGTRKMTIDEIGFFGEDDRDPNADTRDYPAQSIAIYRQVFDSAIEEGDTLMSGPGVLLCMRLGLITRDRQYRPEIVQPLFHYLTVLGGTWWKDCLSKYRISP